MRAEDVEHSQLKAHFDTLTTKLRESCGVLEFDQIVVDMRTVVDRAQNPMVGPDGTAECGGFTEESWTAARNLVRTMEAAVIALRWNQRFFSSTTPSAAAFDELHAIATPIG